MYGMRLSQFSPEILSDILDIYFNVCGGKEESMPRVILYKDFILKDLEKRSFHESRFGSRLMWKGREDRDAKFIIRCEHGIYKNDVLVDKLIEFSFDRNIVENDEALQMMVDFRSEVQSYLLLKGLLFGN